MTENASLERPLIDVALVEAGSSSTKDRQSVKRAKVRKAIGDIDSFFSKKAKRGKLYKSTFAFGIRC